MASHPTPYLVDRLYINNVSKCKYFVISRKSHPLQPSFDLKISDSPLTRVAEFKYLGVWLTEKLRHVKFISKTATKAAGVLFRKFYRHASSKTLLRMFLAVVRPLLEYAAPVWDPHQLSLISTLERIQKLNCPPHVCKGLVCKLRGFAHPFLFSQCTCIYLGILTLLV